MSIFILVLTLLIPEKILYQTIKKSQKKHVVNILLDFIIKSMLHFKLLNEFRGSFLLYSREPDEQATW